MIIQKSKNGFQFVGRDGGKIGPAAFILGVADLANQAGTVEAAASSTLTGTTTAFNTALVVGDFIEFATTIPFVAYVYAIGGATSLTMHDPDNLTLPLVVTIPALTTYKIFRSTWAGKTAPDGIKITVDESTVETKSSDRGESPENVYSSGQMYKVELTLMEASLDTLSRLLPGIVNVTRDVNGLIVAASYGSRTGFDYKLNSQQVAFIEYTGISISALPADRLDCFKMTFSAAFATTKNSTDQQGITLTGFMFEDETRKVNGIPQYMATNLPAMAFD